MPYKDVYYNFPCLMKLSTPLLSSFFITAPEKSRFMIFTHKHYDPFPNIILDKQLKEPVSSITYLGLMLYPKLICVPHFQYISDNVSRYSNVLQSMAGICWRSHPSSLLLIFNAVIKSIANYGSFICALLFLPSYSDQCFTLNFSRQS